MTTARLVPVIIEMDGDELDATNAWKLARKHGLVKIALESFVRFRYGDGFTNSRAAHLEALRTGQTDPVLADPGRPRAHTVDDRAHALSG